MPNPCAEPNCVAFAVEGKAFCAVHGAGYHVHESAHELRCWWYHRTIARGDWYRRDQDGVRHLRACRRPLERR